MALPTLHIPRDLGAARTNLGDKLRREPIADLRMTPRELVEYFVKDGECEGATQSSVGRSPTAGP